MQHTAHMGYGYTQIWSLIGFAHGQIYIGIETHSFHLFGMNRLAIDQSARAQQAHIFHNRINRLMALHNTLSTNSTRVLLCTRHTHMDGRIQIIVSVQSRRSGRKKTM